MSFAHFSKFIAYLTPFYIFALSFALSPYVTPCNSEILRSVLMKIMVKVFQISYVIAQHL